MRVPLIQPSSPADAVAALLVSELALAPAKPLPKSSTSGSTPRRPPPLPYTFVDFCAGAGGPTPRIEQRVNDALSAAGLAPAPFVLTDLHPHVGNWEAAAAASASGMLRFERDGVDASAAPETLLDKWRQGATRGEARRVFRLFSLAFHHFDDPLAKAILRDTLETSDGFGYGFVPPVVV